jgi:hypothetical protein
MFLYFIDFVFRMSSHFWCLLISWETKLLSHQQLYFYHWPWEIPIHSKCRPVSLRTHSHHLLVPWSHMVYKTKFYRHRVHRLSGSTPMPEGRYLQMIGFRCLPAGAHWKSMQMRPLSLAEDINLQEPCRHKHILGP